MSQMVLTPPAGFTDVYPGPEDYRKGDPSAAVFSRRVPSPVPAGDRTSADHAVAAWLLSAIIRLVSLQKLPPDWDTYGSPQVKTVAVYNAILILVAASKLGASAPRLGPVSGGGVQVEWDIGERGLELECLPGGTREYLKVEGGVMTEAAFNPAEIPGLVSWVMQG
ncbi:MAG: hypothetical protein ACRC33_05785 [Gemmataceae bacterium]